MGLSASQIRYLSLTARQSDLEYQSQIISNARIALANRSSDANKAYTDAMSNKVIRIANGYEEGTKLKTWTELTYENAMESGFQIMGGGGESLVPTPYFEYTAGQEISEETYNALPESVKSKFLACGYDLNISENNIITLAFKGMTISKDVYDKLFAGHKELCSLDSNGNYHVDGDIVFRNTTSPITGEMLDILRNPRDYGIELPNGVDTLINGDEYTARANTVYRAKGFARYLNPDYKGMDIQTLLVSGRGQIVSADFFNFLCEHGYGTGKYYSIVDGKREERSYKELLEQYQNEKSGAKTVIDWRADVSNIFKEVLYTEDDAQALAEFEAATSEIQAEDKKLELELKRIETEHKAIETEMESLKKVIDKNIENTYKTFG